MSEDDHDPRVSRFRLPSAKKTPRSRPSSRRYPRQQRRQFIELIRRDLAYRQTKYTLSFYHVSHVIGASWPPVSL